MAAETKLTAQEKDPNHRNKFLNKRKIGGGRNSLVITSTRDLLEKHLAFREKNAYKRNQAPAHRASA